MPVSYGGLHAMHGHADAGLGSASHAVLIGIDGLDVRTLHTALRTGHAPTLKALRESGAYTDDARVTQPSSSLVNWASTLSGAPPAFHGVHGTRTLGTAVRPATYPDRAIYPNLFSTAREVVPALATAAFVSWPPLMQLLQPTSALNASVLLTCQNCQECIEVEPRLVTDFAAQLAQKRFALSWIYIDVLDECGHTHGTAWDGYLPLVQKVDSWVEQILAALSVAEIRKQTTVLVMSDHGRESSQGRSHGGFSTSEMSVQWLLNGPAVRHGARLQWPVLITDCAPTLLHALGITPSSQMHGRVVSEAFEGGRRLWRAREFATHNQTQSSSDSVEARIEMAEARARSSFSHGVASGVAVCVCVLGVAAVAAVLYRSKRRRSISPDVQYTHLGGFGGNLPNF